MHVYFTQKRERDALQLCSFAKASSWILSSIHTGLESRRKRSKFTNDFVPGETYGTILGYNLSMIQLMLTHAISDSMLPSVSYTVFIPALTNPKPTLTI